MQDIKNIVIIAHVDHGKTTTVDKLLQARKLFRENQETDELILDNVPAEILNTYITNDERDHNEYVFWPLEAPAIYNINIPEWKEALLFSFETDSEWS